MKTSKHYRSTITNTNSQPIKKNEEKADLYWRAWNNFAKRLGINHPITKEARQLYDQYSIIITNGVAK